MALSAKSEGLKRVPWFSLLEWHQVYKQVYSNDDTQQAKAYQTLLVWKARAPKLPIGVESTLSLLQVCLRDREWTQKMNEATLPMCYENDLCLMYSTAIMRFLNQISNVGHTKQTSMYQIAKELKIPEWIVNLRHDTAHGHELPPIDAMRMAANILLTWLHEEYWAAEEKAIEEKFGQPMENEQDERSCEAQALVVFFELWTAISLYMRADHSSISDLPDATLRRTLLNLCTVLPENPLQKKKNTDTLKETQNEDNYSLSDARKMLFTEITTLLGKMKFTPNVEDIVMRMLFDCEAFLPNSEIIGIFVSENANFNIKNSNNLPVGMLEFWQDFISLLHEKELLEELLWRLVNFVNSLNEDANKRVIASLWMKSLCNSLLKLRVAQGVMQAMEHSLDDKNKRLSSKQIIYKVREIVNKTNPELSSTIWLETSRDIPNFLKDFDFVVNLILDPNPLMRNFIQSILDLATPSISAKNKEYLLKLVKIQTRSELLKGVSAEDEKIYSLEDLKKICGEQEQYEFEETEVSQRLHESEIADQTIRNESWNIASAEYDWAACPFGILPWQIESLEMIEPEGTEQPRPLLVPKETSIVPGFIDPKLLTTKSQVNWDNVLKQKQKLKKKRSNVESEVIVDRAIEIIKNRKK